jgi:hypothetical protein
MKSIKSGVTLNHIITICLLSLVPGVTPAHAQLSAYLNAPRTSSSIFSGTTVEDFNALSTGNITTTYASGIGNYLASGAAPLNIEGGGVPWSWDGTTHMAVGVQSSSTGAVSLILSSPRNYFGFGWAAGDDQNRMSFYSGDTLLGTFSSATIQSILGGTNVTAVDGNTYLSADYRGQPASPSTNSGENYAFVNFIADSGLTFNRIDFWNNNTGSGFESDNHTILTSGTATRQGNMVFVTSVSSAPEPAVCLFMMPGAAILLKRWKRNSESH